MRPEELLAIEQEILKSKVTDRNFIELTMYQGIALWWFIRYRLYHAAESSQLIKAFLSYSIFMSIVDFLYDFLTSVFWRLLMVPLKFRPSPKRKSRVLISAQEVQWGSFRGFDGELRKGDVYFDYIIMELKKRNYEIVTAHPIGYSIFGLKIAIARLRRRDTIHKAFNIYWSVKIWKKVKAARSFFRVIWKNIVINDEKTVSLLRKYRLTNELEYCFNYVFERIIKRIEMATEMIEREKPDLILMINEYAPFGQALIAAAKLKKVPSLALQHGNLGFGYMYSKEHSPRNGNSKTPYYVIPDKTAVFGQHYYDFLTKTSTYPPDIVAITGQPRHDIFAMADKVYSRQNFCVKLKLNPDRKIVLVITENVPAPKGEVFLRGVLKALKKISDVQIVVKPHPGERGEWYNSVVADENAASVVLPKDAETFEALYACDLLVAGFSATITEAILLGKLVVAFLPTESEDFAPYYKQVTLRVYTEENLVSVMNSALFDKEVKERLRKAGEKFVKAHEYRQDGKATERVVDLIEKMIRERKSRNRG